jgi:hypothetical protein
MCVEMMLLGEGLLRCCAACSLGKRWHDMTPTRRATSNGTSGQPSPAPSSGRMSESEQDATARNLLALAGKDDSGIETAADAPSIAAYCNLAKSRGVSLERVIHAAVRDELRSIVQLPPR